MEGEIKAWEHSEGEEVKFPKPKGSILMFFFYVFSFTTPKARVEDENEEENFDSSDDEEMRKKEIKQEINDPIIDKMEVEAKEQK